MLNKQQQEEENTEKVNKQYLLHYIIYIDFINRSVLIELSLLEIDSVFKIDNLHIKCPIKIKKDIRTNLTKRALKKKFNLIQYYKNWLKKGL